MGRRGNSYQHGPTQTFIGCDSIYDNSISATASAENLSYALEEMKLRLQMEEK